LAADFKGELLDLCKKTSVTPAMLRKLAQTRDNLINTARGVYVSHDETPPYKFNMLVTKIVPTYEQATRFRPALAPTQSLDVLPGSESISVPVF
jgi:hypothetical protein